MNKRRLLGAVTWLATISTLVLCFPIIALGVFKLKEFITSRTCYQALLTSSVSSINRYEPESVTHTTYAIIASVEDWITMFAILVLTIILWGIKIRYNKKMKQ